LSKQRNDSFADAAFLKTTRLISQMRFGAAAVVPATAARYSRRIRDMHLEGYASRGIDPHNLRRQEALEFCQPERVSFVCSRRATASCTGSA
jgi:hypothetical protein